MKLVNLLAVPLYAVLGVVLVVALALVGPAALAWQGARLLALALRRKGADRGVDLVLPAAHR